MSSWHCRMCVEAIDFKGVATSYRRDGQGNAIQETSADIGGRSTRFDALGQTTQISRDGSAAPPA